MAKKRAKSGAKPKTGKPANSSKASRGRPSGFKPEFVAQAKKLCEHGLTDIEIADFFEVSVRSIYRWQSEHPAFGKVFKRAKDPADDRMERSLYSRGVGFEWDEQQAIKLKKITYGENGKKIAEEERIEIVTVRKLLPPDTVAGIFWLKNRRKDDWRDKQDHEHGVTDELGALLAALDGKTRGIPGAGSA
jgi:hypothetical protein